MTKARFIIPFSEELKPESFSGSVLGEVMQPTGVPVKLGSGAWAPVIGRVRLLFFGADGIEVEMDIPTELLATDVGHYHQQGTL